MKQMKTRNTIEAYGVKGMDCKPWRREFRDTDHLNKWAEKNDAEVYGIRDLEDLEVSHYEKSMALKISLVHLSNGNHWQVWLAENVVELIWATPDNLPLLLDRIRYYDAQRVWNPTPAEVEA
jgi:hypothetical protein